MDDLPPSPARCAGCGFVFPTDVDGALRIIATMPERYRSLLEPLALGRVGERFLHLRTARSAWSPVELVAHVAAGVAAGAQALGAPDTRGRKLPVIIEAPSVRDNGRTVADVLATLDASADALAVHAASTRQVGDDDAFA